MARATGNPPLSAMLASTVRKSASSPRPPKPSKNAGTGPAADRAARLREKHEATYSPEKAAENERVLQSLRIETDPRFKAIKHYTDAPATDHLRNLCGRADNGAQAPGGMDKDAGGASPRRRTVTASMMDKDAISQMSSGPSVDEVSFKDLAEMELSMCEDSGANQQKLAVEDRLEWQDSFDRSVKRLMVDFTLSEVPTDRLNHLERMHKWFGTHGAKQVRKAAEPPCFSYADRAGPGRAPPGSAQNVPGKLGGTALILAGSVSMRRSKNVPQGPAGYVTGPSPSPR